MPQWQQQHPSTKKKRLVIDYDQYRIDQINVQSNSNSLKLWFVPMSLSSDAVVARGGGKHVATFGNPILFTEPAWYQGYYSPFYNDSHRCVSHFCTSVCSVCSVLDDGTDCGKVRVCYVGLSFRVCKLVTPRFSFDAGRSERACGSMSKSISSQMLIGGWRRASIRPWSSTGWPTSLGSQQ